MSYSYTANQQVFIPETEIKKDKPEYIYVPLRGYSHSLAVFNIEDACIGWIKVETLGYDSAKEWMTKTKWVDQGY